jgi:hypothetical protein
MRSSPLVLASFFFATVAHAQGAPIEKCTGNFEEAQLKEKRGKLVEAEQLYAACAATECPSMIRTDCTAKREEVIRRIPTVTVVIRDASGADVTASVEIDGKPVADRARAQALDPGEHTVHYRADGKKPATQKITVVEGEKARVITLSTKDGIDDDGTRASQAAHARDASSEGPAIVGPVILGTVGVLLLGTGIVLQVMAKSEDDKAQDFAARANAPDVSEINRAELASAASSRRDAAERNQVIAIGAGLSGLLFIGGGVAWYLLTRPSKASSAMLAPVIAPGFAGGTLGLRF